MFVARGLALVQGLRASSMIYGSTTPLQSVGQLSDMGYHLVFRPLSGKSYKRTPCTNLAAQACLSPKPFLTAIFDSPTVAVGSTYCHLLGYLSYVQ